MKTRHVKTRNALFVSFHWLWSDSHAAVGGSNGGVRYCKTRWNVGPFQRGLTSWARLPEHAARVRGGRGERLYFVQFDPQLKLNLINIFSNKGNFKGERWGYGGRHFMRWDFEQGMRVLIKAFYGNLVILSNKRLISKACGEPLFPRFPGINQEHCSNICSSNSCPPTDSFQAAAVNGLSLWSPQK